MPCINITGDYNETSLILDSTSSTISQDPSNMPSQNNGTTNNDHTHDHTHTNDHDDHDHSDILAMLNQEVQRLTSLIDGNASQILTLDNEGHLRAGLIADNTAGISANTAGISANASDVATNAAGVVGNASGIADNAADVATNASGVAGNAAGVATNASGVATNAAGVATNTSGIQALNILLDNTDKIVLKNQIDIAEGVMLPQYGRDPNVTAGELAFHGSFLSAYNQNDFAISLNMAQFAYSGYVWGRDGNQRSTANAQEIEKLKLAIDENKKQLITQTGDLVVNNLGPCPTPRSNYIVTGLEAAQGYYDWTDGVEVGQAGLDPNIFPNWFRMKSFEADLTGLNEDDVVPFVEATDLWGDGWDGGYLMCFKGEYDESKPEDWHRLMKECTPWNAWFYDFDFKEQYPLRANCRYAYNHTVVNGSYSWWNSTEAGRWGVPPEEWGAVIPGAGAFTSDEMLNNCMFLYTLPSDPGNNETLFCPIEYRRNTFKHGEKYTLVMGGGVYCNEMVCNVGLGTEKFKIPIIETNIANNLSSIQDISARVHTLEKTVNVEHDERLLVLETLVKDGPPIWTNQKNTNNTIIIEADMYMTEASLNLVLWDSSENLVLGPYDVSDNVYLVQDGIGRAFADLKGIKQITYSHNVTFDASNSMFPDGGLIDLSDNFELNIHALDFDDNSFNYTQKIVVQDTKPPELVTSPVYLTWINENDISLGTTTTTDISNILLNGVEAFDAYDGSDCMVKVVDSTISLSFKNTTYPGRWNFTVEDKNGNKKTYEKRYVVNDSSNDLLLGSREARVTETINLEALDNSSAGIDIYDVPTFKWMVAKSPHDVLYNLDDFIWYRSTDTNFSYYPAIADLNYGVLNLQGASAYSDDFTAAREVDVSLDVLATTNMKVDLVNLYTQEILAEASFNVVVDDTTPPVITISGDVNMDVNYADVSMINLSTLNVNEGLEAKFLVSENFKASQVTKEFKYYKWVNSAWVEVNPGLAIALKLDDSYKLELTATDSVDLSSSKHILIDIVDLENPTIMIDANKQKLFERSNVEDFNYSSGVTVSDDISLGSNTLSWTGEVNLAVAGSYGVVYSITDLAGNVATKTFTVTVEDNLAPHIELLDLSLNMEFSISQMQYLEEYGKLMDPDGSANAPDEDLGLCDTSMQYAYDFKVSSLTNGSIDPSNNKLWSEMWKVKPTFDSSGVPDWSSAKAYPGLYRITYSGQDAVGNAAPQKSRDIIVLGDEISPTITCIIDPVYVNVSAMTDASWIEQMNTKTGYFSSSYVQLTDNWTTISDLSLSSDFTTHEWGTKDSSFVEILTVKDEHGQTATAQRTVFVADTTPLQFDLLGEGLSADDRLVVLKSDAEAGLVNVAEVVKHTSNKTEGEDYTVSCSPATVGTGTHTITVTATDNNGDVVSQDRYILVTTLMH